MSKYGVFICEECEGDYFTGPAWLDECYCIECYEELYGENGIYSEECEHGLSAWLCAGPNHYSDEF